MKNDLTCEVVQDLLPSYVDGLTSDVSNQAVEQHLKTCESCRKLYREMQEPMNGENVSDINEGQKADSKNLSEIDYLKKIRSKNRMRILAAVLIFAIAVGVGLWSKVYVIGQKVEQAEFVQADVVVEDHNVSVQGLLLDTTKGVSDVAFQEKDGIVTVSLRETRKSSFHTNEFQVDYQSSEDVKQVVLENRILWDDGVSIDGTVSDLYQSRNPYVGDTSADGRSVQAARAVLVGVWLVRNPLRLAAMVGRIAGLLILIRAAQDIVNASRWNCGMRYAIVSALIGAVLIVLPMTTSRLVMVLLGLVVIVLGSLMAWDRLKLAKIY